MGVTNTLAYYVLVTITAIRNDSIGAYAVKLLIAVFFAILS
jgi:hypothetical protein